MTPEPSHRLVPAANFLAVSWRTIPVASAVLVVASWAICAVSYETHGGGAYIVGFVEFVALAVLCSGFAAFFIVRGWNEKTSALAGIPFSLLAVGAILYLALSLGLRD
jgi:hypothetical protein